MNLDTVRQGTLGWLIPYGLCLIGLWTGIWWARARRSYYVRAVFWALPLTFLVGALWAWLASSNLRIPRTSLAGWPMAVLGWNLVLGSGVLAGRAWARDRTQPTLMRGTRVLAERTAQRLNPQRTVLTLAGIDVPPMDEPKHFKLIGTTGTGKSTAIRELLAGALARADRAIVADPDGSYLRQFYDVNRGDVILNPFDARSARWDVLAEILQPQDADQLARSFIPDYEGPDRNWRNYARTFLTALLRQLHRVQERDVATFYNLLVLAPVEQLRELLDQTPAAPYFGRDNGKFFDSIRSIASTALAGLEQVVHHSASDPPAALFSIRHWVRSTRRGVLFLPYRANEIAALRTLISTWMRTAIFETLNAPTDTTEDSDQKIWFVIDELDALGAIDGLKDALARLRKFGGRCILGLQSIAQVSANFGAQEAQTLIENCGNTLILRCSASEHGGTAHFASRLIGDREIRRPQISHTLGARFSRHSKDSTTYSDQHVIEAAVLPSEIEQLPDLSGFLKFASQPHWRRVSFPHRP